MDRCGPAEIRPRCDAVGNLDVEKIGLAYELSSVGGGGMGVNFTRGVNLFEGAIFEEGDAIGERHGFVLIVSDKEEGDAEFALQRFEFRLHLFAEIGVEGGERLVEQKKLRTIDESASEGDALLLTTAERGRARRGEGIHFHHAKRVGNTSGNFGFAGAGDFKAVGDVFPHVEMREERVILEDSVDATAIRRKGVETRATHPNFAGGGLFETGDEAEQRGFSGAAFAEKGEEFTGGDFETNIFEDALGTEIFGDVTNFQQRGGGPRERSGRHVGGVGGH